MRNWRKLLLITVLIAGCKKPYNPPVVNAPNSYLVVEGVINSGSDSTIIKLSHTVNLSNKNVINPMPGATVTVENDQSGIYPLTETTNGNYVSPGLNLDNSHKYRLRIKTTDNQQYVSDLEAVQVTPPIDSIGYTFTGTSIQIYVNTYNPLNNTRYYRFDYEETWHFHSKYPSSYLSNGSTLELRPNSKQIYTCFANQFSSTILLGSTAKLQEDVLFQNPITTVLYPSEKLEDKYSILVHEYALTPDAYKFWQNLKKNTEQLGSIFDAEPSEIAGNIHNVNNPTEPVIGYISVNTIQIKRVFISNSQLPSSLQPDYPYTCTLDSIWYDNPTTHQNQVAEFLIPLPAMEIPVSPFYKGNPITPAGYLSSYPDCVDCTVRGYTAQPPFWK